MIDDLISREALIQHAYSAVVDGVEKDIIDLSDVDNAPTVEPLESTRPQGEWKVYGRQGGIPITDMCSNCRYEMKWYRNKYNYCPNCGAKMKGGAENDIS